MAVTTGTHLGRYEIRSQLGAGGMGEVYLAQDTKLDRKVALKILPAEVAANHERMRRFTRILKEIEEKHARREALGQHLARVYAGLGEKDQAFAWFEKDFQQRGGLLPAITYDYNVEDLRGDPRYADLVRRMGLTP